LFKGKLVLNNRENVLKTKFRFNNLLIGFA